MRITGKEKKYKQFIEHLLVNRKQHGVLENEADFIAGAGAVFAFLNRMDLVPPMRIFWPLAGRDMVEAITEGKTPFEWLVDNKDIIPDHCK